MSSLPHAPPSRFERFGLYYLNRFSHHRTDRDAFATSDAELSRRVTRITHKGIILSSLVGLLCVYPIVYVDLRFSSAQMGVYYTWMLGVLVGATAIEFYLLFYISLRAVHRVSELIHMEDLTHATLQQGVFGVKNILARTALEIPDPELRVLGIDPFQRISKKNLLVLGLLYKGKIIVSNLLLKTLLRLTVGSQIFGVSILYVAIPVEIFWNSVVIRKVIHEARLRLFGYALANRIADTVQQEGWTDRLSAKARTGCLRAIGNAVVMTQNYHPNMMILLLRFQDLLGIQEEDRYDDWAAFLETLDQVSKDERNFLLDLLTVAAAFDGKLSAIELQHLREAYQGDAPIYLRRLRTLTAHLKHGQLHAAFSLCKLDTVRG